MGLLKYAAAGAAGFIGYKLFQNAREQAHPAPAAFAPNQKAVDDDPSPVRDAGPDAMRDTPRQPWTVEDQQADESFPASDPPSNY